MKLQMTSISVAMQRLFPLNLAILFATIEASAQPPTDAPSASEPGAAPSTAPAASSSAAPPAESDGAPSAQTSPAAPTPSSPDGTSAPQSPVIVAPAIVTDASVSYPDVPEAQRVQATVVLELTVGTDGKASSVEVVSAAGEPFDRIAVE